MDKPSLIVTVGFALLGLLLVVRAGSLSIRYNAWTTRLRERHPNINPPPTPEWRARNTNIMTVVFRIAGAFLLLRSILNGLALINLKPH
jgi:hypothetical protein